MEAVAAFAKRASGLSAPATASGLALKRRERRRRRGVAEHAAFERELRAFFCTSSKWRWRCAKALAPYWLALVGAWVCALQAPWGARLILGVVLAGLGISLLYTWAGGPACRWFLRERMPDELLRARLFMSEVEIMDAVRGRLKGRPDQVFRKLGGACLLLDTKTRARHEIHDRDLWQLSAYASVLRENGRRVCGHAYVRTVVMHRRWLRVRYHRIRLKSEREVRQLLLRAT